MSRADNDIVFIFILISFVFKGNSRSFFLIVYVFSKSWCCRRLHLKINRTSYYSSPNCLLRITRTPFGFVPCILSPFIFFIYPFIFVIYSIYILYDRNLRSTDNISIATSDASSIFYHIHEIPFWWFLNVRAIWILIFIVDYYMRLKNDL